MDAKEYLSQLMRINNSIEMKNIEVENLRTLAESITCATDGDRVQTSGSKDKVGDTVIKIVAVQEEIQHMIVESVNTRLQIMSTIDKVDDSKLIMILYYRYLQNKNWTYISDKLNISYQWVHTLHIRALNKVNKIINT